MIQTLKHKVLSGEPLTETEAYALAGIGPENLTELLDAAAEITDRYCTRRFDSCSIINARSGRCPEDCKWCAQAARHLTGAQAYPMVGRDVCMEMARANKRHGIRRFSLVTSGRALSDDELDAACGHFAEMKREGGLGLCASMGLLAPDQLRRLREAGVERYHCNLETAPSMFPTLCSTHTLADKLATMAAAREAGLEVCSGGIIGMGETMAQRVELALALRDLDPVSIPINILIPIPGTPLEGAAPLTDEEVLHTVAIFRMVNPRAVIRFAGGRERISRQAQLRALRIGINGAIMGDMLTTLGSAIAEDKEMISAAGYEF